MATIKSYTDLSQSKKLAEILPIETADMHYNNASIKGINYVDEYRAELMDYNTAQKVWSKYLINSMFGIIPCWSLAAFMDYLSANFHVDIKYLDNYWELDCHIQVTYNEELVDSCVAMIIKLSELKVL